MDFSVEGPEVVGSGIQVTGVQLDWTILQLSAHVRDDMIRKNFNPIPPFLICHHETKQPFDSSALISALSLAAARKIFLKPAVQGEVQGTFMDLGGSLLCSLSPRLATLVADNEDLRQPLGTLFFILWQWLGVILSQHLSEPLLEILLLAALGNLLFRLVRRSWGVVQVLIFLLSCIAFSLRWAGPLMATTSSLIKGGREVIPKG